jgi:hypothetical protein
MMIKKAASAVVIVVIIFSLFGYRAPAIDAATSIDAQIKNAVYTNAKNLQSENLQKYLDDLYLTAAQKNQLKPGFQQLFKTYDLKYKITKFKILSKTKTTAKVSVTQITTKVKGPAFRNNQTVATHYLKLVKGKWKFTKSVVQTVKYLN